MGHERREVHATGGKMKSREEVKVVMTIGKSVTGMMTGINEADKKRTTETAAAGRDILRQ